MTQVANASQELLAADNYPNIRLFTVDQVASTTPLVDVQKVKQPWSVANRDRSVHIHQ